MRYDYFVGSMTNFPSVVFLLFILSEFEQRSQTHEHSQYTSLQALYKRSAPGGAGAHHIA